MNIQKKVSGYFSMSLLSIGLMLMLTASMMSCASGRKTGTAIGAATGAAAGAAAAGDGSEAEGAVIGTVVGGAAGYGIGRSLETTDKQKIAAGLNNLPAGQTKSWTSGSRRFAMTPDTSYKNSSGQTCRDFSLRIVNQGETNTLDKTGCKDAISGKWEIR